MEHPGIVPVYGLGTHANGRPFYAMRFIRGDSLKEAIDRFHKVDKPGRDPTERSLELRKLLGRFIDVCQAIEYAHSRGVLHRDLKPGNVMLGKYGETLVVDWGLAKPVGKSETESKSEEPTIRPNSGSGSAPTQRGSAIGTPAYMSPEQAAGRLDQLGPASDVYSLGATLYSLLTGQAPITDSDVAAVLRRVQNGDFPTPSEVHSEVRNPLEAICLKAMALDQEHRYASPQLLANDVERFLADESVTAHAEPVSVRARRWQRKHPKSVAAIAATVLVGLGSAILFSAIISGKNSELADANSDLFAANAVAERATKEEQEARIEAQVRAYCGFIARAEQFWRDGDVPRAERLLDRCDPRHREWEWKYLKSLCDSERLKLTGHTSAKGEPHATGPVLNIAFSPSGHRLASAGGGNIYYSERGQTPVPGEVIIRTAADGRIEHTFSGFDHLVHDLDFSPNGERIAAAGKDGVIRVWNVQTGDEILKKKVHADGVLHISYTPDGETLAFATKGQEGRSEIRFLSAHNLEHQQNLPEELIIGEIECIAFGGPNKMLFACGGTAAPYDVLLWNWETKSIHQWLRGHTNAVHDVMFSPDGNHVATVSHDASLRVWNTNTGTQEALIRADDTHLTVVAFAPDGNQVAASGAGGMIHIWNIRTERRVRVIRGHAEETKCLAFSPNGEYLASGSVDGTVRVWGMDRKQRGTLLDGNTAYGPRADLSFSDDDRTIYVAHAPSDAKSGIIDQRNLVTGVPSLRPIQPEPSSWNAHPRNDYAFSPNGKLMAAPIEQEGDRNTISVWDAANLDVQFQLHGHKKEITAIEFSHNGTEIVSVDIACQIRVWNALDGGELYKIEIGPIQGEYPIRCVALHSLSNLIAFSDLTNNCVKIWDRQRQVKQINDVADCRDLAFSPDGQWLVAADFDKSHLHVLNVETGELRKLDANRNVNSVCFSGDSKRLLASGYNGHVKFWHTETGEEIMLLQSFGKPPGTAGFTSKVVFSHDETRLASLNFDGSINLWEIGTWPSAHQETPSTW